MSGLTRVVLVAGARTPFLDSGGAYSPLMTYELAAHSIAGLVSKTGVDVRRIGMVTMGTVLHEIETSNVARESMLTAGLPATIPAYTTSMAGLSASVGFANLCDMIALGRIEAGIAGGVESFSDIPIRFSQTIRRAAMKVRQDPSAKNILKLVATLRPRDLLPEMPKGTDFTTKKVMGVCAEAMVKKFSVSRADCDAFTERSHQLALTAIAAGRYADELVPVHVPSLNTTVTDDDTPRADCTHRKLVNMKPIFDTAQGVITAAGSSRFTDGSAAVLMTSEQAAQSMGLTPKAVVVDYQFSAVKDLNTEMLLGPAVTIPKLLGRHGLHMDDIGVWELHEAFAAQILVNVACMARPEFADEYHAGQVPGQLPMDRLNAWGGSLALGNPFAATGMRLLSTAANRLQAEGQRYAVVSSCAGGGLGAAILLQNPNV
ncbi:thiolase family protein [Limnobacter humi]|uniref:Thiolase family protein n=1 Tax=Limnobacter humi TaxID=1778671 RepID=A0ABT1WFU7_9BURK|nr:thiolase family protein [Limnobacter humi]MCQ8896396.1 thiolase family protein [Limnobacter humi]